MKSILFSLLVVGVSVCGGGSLLIASGAPQSPKARSARKAKAAPATIKPAVVMAINTEELQSLLRRDNNRPLLVNYWATWCDLCREEFPDLVKIDKDYQATPLDFIAITLDDKKDMNTEVAKFLRAMKAKMRVYLLDLRDPEPAINLVGHQWSGTLPATFLYNGSGEVVYKEFGRVKPDELRAAIDKLVSSKQ